MVQIVFMTPRLRCRRWIASDLQAIHATYSDPEVVRYVGDGTPITPAQCEEWMSVTARNYATWGYGMFALESRNDAGLVGFCGLVHPGGQPDAEIKYAFMRQAWGQGLASEAVPALLRHGHDAHGLDRIVATVAPANLASQQVLSKVGARRIAERLNDDGSTTWVYEWRAGRP